MTNFVGPVYELFCRKPKICNGFCKTNFEPEPNNQLSDSYYKLVIRHPHVGQFSMQIWGVSGSVLDANQQSVIHTISANVQYSWLLINLESVPKIQQNFRLISDVRIFEVTARYTVVCVVWSESEK